MTQQLFLDDPYLRDAPAVVKGLTDEGGIILDRSVFYPTGGGQPGDCGWLTWDGLRMPVATAIKGQGEDIILVPAEPMALPPLGAHVTQVLDWDRRHRHMRLHTALHLLTAVIPYAVTGGQISISHGRLDFDMPDMTQDRNAIDAALNDFVGLDAKVSVGWITGAELDANPHLVKTMAVQPPRGADRIRLVRIGDQESPIDLQPCGGTHVARTGEIGALRLGRIEKKCRQNRRIYLHLES